MAGKPGLAAFSVLMAFSVFAGPVAATALSAGDVDDNLQFEHYVDWAGQAVSTLGPSYGGLNLSDRVTVRVVDGEGKPVPGAKVEVFTPGADAPFVAATAGSDGVFRLFPAHDGAGNATQLLVRASDGRNASLASQATVDLAALDGQRSVTLEVEGASSALPDALDLMVVLDTTGSMADEHSYLVKELAAIAGTVRNDTAGLDMRFGLVVYRDRGDDYVVRSFPFTRSLDDIQVALAAQVAWDGGDYWEAMDDALREAMNASWGGAGTARVILLVADAPPHPEVFGRAVDVFDAARRAGVRIHSLAGSGAGLDAEFAMRAASILTQGRYMFLTDDSGVGGAHGLPHVECYEVTALTDLVVRVIEGEAKGRRIEADNGTVIRTVGNITRGVCVDDAAQLPPDQPRLPAVVEGGSAGSTSAAGGETPGWTATGSAPLPAVTADSYGDSDLYVAGSFVGSSPLPVAYSSGGSILTADGWVLTPVTAVDDRGSHSPAISRAEGISLGEAAVAASPDAVPTALPPAVGPPGPPASLDGGPTGATHASAQAGLSVAGVALALLGAVALAALRTGTLPLAARWAGRRRRR